MFAGLLSLLLPSFSRASDFSSPRSDNGSYPKISKESRYDSLFKYYGEKHRVDWLLLKAQVKIESQFNPNAIGSKGEKGLAQFMPGAWAEWAPEGGHTPDPHNPEASIRTQAKYMAWLLDEFSGNVDDAVAAYNWGIRNVRYAMRDNFGDWRTAAPVTTRNYVAMVRVLYRSYKEPRVRSAKKRLSAKK